MCVYVYIYIYIYVDTPTYYAFKKPSVIVSGRKWPMMEAPEFLDPGLLTTVRESLRESGGVQGLLWKKVPVLGELKRGIHKRGLIISADMYSLEANQTQRRRQKVQTRLWSTPPSLFSQEQADESSAKRKTGAGGRMDTHRSRLPAF